MKQALITGGAGFVGTNLAERLALNGYAVTIFDNLSRPGVEHNLSWLKLCFPEAIRFERGDVRDPSQVERAIRRVDLVFHFAAQVAVTTSLLNPVDDFEINVRGTLNVLEAIRKSASRPPLFFTSTNKVYGGLDDLPLETENVRYQPADPMLRSGISESRTLDFHSPYGCSKGAADQYVLDYARSFDMRAVVFRMSCIYGPHQLGTEDQGWIAHFLLQALQHQPILICGDGMQVRDALYVDDLLSAFELAHEHIDSLSGQAFNMGGGPANGISLLDVLALIQTLHGQAPEYACCDWRTGDQRYYVSDTRRFERATGWRPHVAVAEGIERLYLWLKDVQKAHWLDTSPARNGHALLAR